MAFCYFSRIRFSKKPFAFLKTLGFSKNRWVFSLFGSRFLARCPASPL
nr:MAG TPA: hypothetical protein [Caudoviricetes sp.]